MWFFSTQRVGEQSSHTLFERTLSLRYLSHPHDVETLLKGIRLVQRLVNTSTFDGLHGRLLVQNAVSPHPHDSDKFWEWYIRQSTLSLHHPVGTCRMGSRDDPSVVVDPKLMLRG